MGMLDLFKAPVLTPAQRADVQRHVTCVYEGGSRARPDWAGEPLAPVEQDAPAAPAVREWTAEDYAASDTHSREPRPTPHAKPRPRWV